MPKSTAGNHLKMAYRESGYFTDCQNQLEASFTMEAEPSARTPFTI